MTNQSFFESLPEGAGAKYKNKGWCKIEDIINIIEVMAGYRPTYHVVQRRIQTACAKGLLTFNYIPDVQQTYILNEQDTESIVNIILK